MDQVGYTPKGGPVTTHILIAEKSGDIHSARINAGGADLILVVQPPGNEWSVTAGTFRARRGRADVARLLQAAATPRGAFRRSPEGRAHKRPSVCVRGVPPRAPGLSLCMRGVPPRAPGLSLCMRGVPPRAPGLRAPLSALDVCWIRPRADAAHLNACGRADRSFPGGWTTRLRPAGGLTYLRVAVGSSLARAINRFSRSGNQEP